MNEVPEEAELSYPPEIQAAIDRERDPQNRIEPAKTLHKPHAIVQAWVDQEKGYLFKASPTKIRKRKIFSCLFKELEKRGFKVETDTRYSNASIYVVQGTNRIEFSIVEKLRYVRKPPADEPNNTNKKSWIQFREPTGLFELDIKYWPRKNVISTFLDTADQKLENRFNEIIISFIKIMWHTEQYRLLEQQRNEISQQKKEAEERRQQQIQQENQRKAVLRSNSLAWADADLLRRYVQSVEEKMAGTADAGKFGEWKSWALSHANEIDPLTNGTALNIEDFPEHMRVEVGEECFVGHAPINPFQRSKTQNYFATKTFIGRRNI